VLVINVNAAGTRDEQGRGEKGKGDAERGVAHGGVLHAGRRGETGGTTVAYRI
jgi:hypothetical protein